METSKTLDTAIAVEKLKSEYLELYRNAIPRLKEMATQLRQQENLNFSEDKIDQFWRITDDPKVNYELSQLAENLDWYDEAWLNHPDNPNREALSNSLTIADDLPMEPDPRTAKDLWDMYCLEVLEEKEKVTLSAMLLVSCFPPEDRVRFGCNIVDANLKQSK